MSPLGDQASSRSMPVLNCCFAFGLGVCPLCCESAWMSHRKTCPSSFEPAEASMLPAGDQASEATGLLCPCSSRGPFAPLPVLPCIDGEDEEAGCPPGGVTCPEREREAKAQMPNPPPAITRTAPPPINRRRRVIVGAVSVSGALTVAWPPDTNVGV